MRSAGWGCWWRALLYDSSDTECAGEPIGGPFPISGDPGSRTLLLLYGSTDAMNGMVLPIT